ncbi:MAG: hypothetical protein ACR2IV_23970 [Bryobacteraceae bacterium]
MPPLCWLKLARLLLFSARSRTAYERLSPEPMGRYNLHDETPGFRAAERRRSSLKIDQHAYIDLQLRGGRESDPVGVGSQLTAGVNTGNDHNITSTGVMGDKTLAVFRPA